MRWREEFAQEFGSSIRDLPSGIRENPEYFCYIPSGHVLAQTLQKKGFFETNDWRILATATRYHLFTYALYKVETGPDAIVERELLVCV